MQTVLLWILSVLLIVAGFFGTVFPALPGAPLVFCGLFLAVWIDNFDYVGWQTLTALGVLTVAALIVDVAATALGAKRVGASRAAIFGAALGTLFGVFGGIPGILVGPFIGAAVGEFYSRRELGQAGKVGLATWLGLLLGTVAKIVIIFWMIGLFVLMYFI